MTRTHRRKHSNRQLPAAMPNTRLVSVRMARLITMRTSTGPRMTNNYRGCMWRDWLTGFGRIMIE